MLHHATLKSAVAKYKVLAMEGKSENDIKIAISQDEKEFDSDAINEIYAAVVAIDEDNDAKQGKYAVVSHFRDLSNFSIAWNEGDDVSHFDEDRLKKLVELKLVELQ